MTELGEKQDAVVLRVLVAGEKAGGKVGYEYNMVTIRNRQGGVTAMARATAYTISTVTQMIGNGLIDKRGAYPPELIVPGQKYIDEMAKKGVEISETVHRSA